MDGGAGIAIGMSCGIGAGIGIGIASGRAGLQQEMLKKAKTMEATHSITIKDGSGNHMSTEDFIRELVQAESACCDSSKSKVIMVAIGILILLCAVMGLFFFMR